MNKSELIEQVATLADIPKTVATKAVDAMLSAVSTTLAAGEEVVLLNFGTFDVKERRARTGRHPVTGDPINIEATKVPSFRAGKALKCAVNE